MFISTSKNAPVVSVIGGGPAGLMAAEVLSEQGLQVDVYDAMPSAGRKFLLAGKGGLNISHSEPKDRFLSRYGTRQNQLKPMLEAFGPEALTDWVHGLGVKTFTGTSGRIFPAEMKAAPLLRAWLHRLRSSGVNFYMKHQWLGWCDGDYSQLRFLTADGERHIRTDAVVLALGGGSWPKFGSTGAWVPVLLQQGVQVAPLQPANCGFDVNWSEYFRHHFAGEPLKSVVISFTDRHGAAVSRKGELVITANGVEGSVIYAMSAFLRDEIAASGTVDIHIDLVPDQNLQALIDSVSLPRGKLSMANHLRKRIGIYGVKAGCLREIASKTDFDDPARLCSLIKMLPVRLVAARPIDEAISSAGGVIFDALDDQLMIRAMPGVFCAGEMLDWEAPTGGYLLTACFASGRSAGYGVEAWLRSNASTKG
jgi:uncharacterized flavoprotein (TIGR03862 family)